MLNKQGWLFLSIMAVLGVGVYVLTHWTDCKRTETREVEMTSHSRYGYGRDGIVKRQYKVCVER